MQFHDEDSVLSVLHTPHLFGLIELNSELRLEMDSDLGVEGNESRVSVNEKLLLVSFCKAEEVSR